MASSLKNKSTVCMLWKVPEHGVQAMRDFFEFHFEYMKEKSYREGELKLIQYSISESPEYVEDLESWLEGKFPETTGRTIFHLFEIYETPNGLHHHFIDAGKPGSFGSELIEMIKTYEIEWQTMNQMKIIQSLSE